MTSTVKEHIESTYLAKGTASLAVHYLVSQGCGSETEIVRMLRLLVKSGHVEERARLQCLHEDPWDGSMCEYVWERDTPVPDALVRCPSCREVFVSEGVGVKPVFRMSERWRKELGVVAGEG